MKILRILLPTIFAILPFASRGASMCVPNNIYYGVLVPEHAVIEPTTTDGMIWTVTADYVVAVQKGITYNIITGFASCNEITGTADSIAGNVSASTDVTGPNCWCGVSKPLAQKFVAFTGTTYATDVDCEANCAALCVTKMKAQSDTFRTALYNGTYKF